VQVTNTTMMGMVTNDVDLNDTAAEYSNASGSIDNDVFHDKEIEYDDDDDDDDDDDGFEDENDDYYSDNDDDDDDD
jgi:hypothetical protein